MLILTTVLSSILLAQDPPKPAPKPPPDHPARASFVANCAQCHGENGDGKGATKLDRPARSFQDGGFSYGNTPEALLRTITFGIPGTPMPSFEKALSVEQRKSLAEYVLLLGPPVEKTDPKASVMVVKDKPLVVRGKLPPLVPGGKETVRGLLIGTPEGLTFEYRVDDVRLLGVLSGDFVDRADWRGRGGDALVPLGKVAWADANGGAPPLFFDPSGSRSACESRFLGTVVVRDHVLVRYMLGSHGKPLAEVTEIPRPYSNALGAGISRGFIVSGSDRDVALSITLGVDDPPRTWSGSSPKITWWCRKLSETTWEARVVSFPLKRGTTPGHGIETITDFSASEQEPRTFQLYVIPCATMPASESEREAAFLKEFGA